jgi:hypothetical protein
MMDVYCVRAHDGSVGLVFEMIAAGKNGAVAAKALGDRSRASLALAV